MSFIHVSDAFGDFWLPEQSPADVSNLLAFGEALRLQGKTSEAVAAYSRVLELQPGFPNARKMLAYLQGIG